MRKRLPSRRPANWRMPPEADGKAGAGGCASAGSRGAGPGTKRSLPDDLWDAVLADPRTAGRPLLSIQQCRLSEIPRHVPRVECCAASASSKFRRLMPSDFMGHMPSGKTSGSDCSTRPAPIAQAATRKTDAGRARLRSRTNGNGYSRVAQNLEQNYEAGADTSSPWCASQVQGRAPIASISHR
jgi:hypothetical protein